MPTDRSRALAEFKRMILWIALAGVAMVAGALWYISSTSRCACTW
jgi:hypothetical protein